MEDGRTDDGQEAIAKGDLELAPGELKIIFLLLHKNICCGYSLEKPCQKHLLYDCQLKPSLIG